MTDRDILIGLVSAVGALAERLTGDKMVITITDEDGRSHRVGASGSVNIDWDSSARSKPFVSSNPEPCVSVYPTSCTIDGTPLSDKMTETVEISTSGWT